MPETEYQALNGGKPFHPATAPDSVTNTALSHQQAVYDREQIALGYLTRAVFDSIPAATQQSCPGYHANYGTSFITLPTMLTHAQQTYGAVTVTGYNIAKSSLLRPYAPGTNIDAFLASHVDAHLACIRAGNALNNIEKVDALINAVGGRTGIFAFTIQAFEEATSDLAHRTFEDSPATDQNPVREGLASRIRKAALRLLTTTDPATATTSGYYGAAAAASALPPKSIRDEVTSALQELLPSLVATAIDRATNAANATATRAANANATRVPQEKKYCWTHGLCAHTGQECRTPDRQAGHNPKATLTRKMGGSIKGCPK